MEITSIGLVGFLRVAHELFGVEFPEQEIQEAVSSTNPGDFNDQISQILVSHGWTERAGGFYLTNVSGMVMAHIRPCDYVTIGQENGFGGFFYCTPYPEDLEERRREINALFFFPCEDQIQQYEERAPGIQVGCIDITTMRVTSWNRQRIQKNTQDFKDWVKIFERLFDNLDFSESYGWGEIMFEALYDPYWQWTDLDPKTLKDMLKRIAESSQTAEEVCQRVRDELGYPFPDVWVIKKWCLVGENRGFVVEIKGPMGRAHRIMSHET